MTEYDEIFEAQEVEDDKGTEPVFDKEEWIQQKKAERTQAYELIDTMAGIIACVPDKFKEYLDVESRFERYSVGNMLLIAAQNPEATRIADYKTWKEEGVNIKRGESGIIILEPGTEYTREDGSVGVSYNAKRVFDIAQTTAERKETIIHRDDRLLLKALIHNAPCQIKIDETVRFPEGMCAFYDPTEKVIYVDRGQEADALFQNIARELAHAHMDKEAYDREKVSFTACCVSYVLSMKNGVDVSAVTFEMPESWGRMEPKAVRVELGKIRDTVNAISMDMSRLTEKQKEAKSKDDAR